MAHFPHLIVLVAVGDIESRDLRLARAHQSILDLVLDLLDGQVTVCILGVLLDAVCNLIDLLRRQTLTDDAFLLIGAFDRIRDLRPIKRNPFSGALHNTELHVIDFIVAVELFVVDVHSFPPESCLYTGFCQ